MCAAPQLMCALQRIPGVWRKHERPGAACPSSLKNDWSYQTFVRDLVVTLCRSLTIRMCRRAVHCSDRMGRMHLHMSCRMVSWSEWGEGMSSPSCPLPAHLRQALSP